MNLKREMCSHCIVYKMKHDGLKEDSFKLRTDMSLARLLIALGE